MNNIGDWVTNRHANRMRGKVIGVHNSTFPVVQWFEPDEVKGQVYLELPDDLEDTEPMDPEPDLAEWPGSAVLDE